MVNGPADINLDAPPEPAPKPTTIAASEARKRMGTVAESLEDGEVRILPSKPREPVKPAVHEQLSKFQEALSDLTDAKEALSDKLGDVLSPIAEEEHLQDEAPVTGASNIATNISKGTNTIVRLTKELRSIVDRIEL